MAHDVWLLRGAVVACLLLSTFTGAESIPIKDDISEVGHKVKHEINFTRKESTAARMQMRLWNKRSTGSYGRHQTKRGVTKGTAETGASKSRMQILDKYYVNPEIVKKGAIEENVSEGDKETYQSALLLEEPNLETERNHFENGELSEEPLNVEKYGAHSVEGTKIANAASLLANSVESHGVKVAESVINKYPRQNISKLPVAFRYDSPAQTSNTRGKFMQRSRFRYVNSLIKPQLAGISDDMNDLEALRNHAKELNVRAPNNGLKSPERKLDGQLWEESTAIGENANKHTEKPSSTKKERNYLSEYNTEIKTDAGYNPEDMFLLGTPDDTRYFQNVFMENPGAGDLFTSLAQDEPVHSKVGSVVQPTPPWQRSGATVPLKQEEMLEKLVGESESSEFGLLPSGDESDLNEGSDDPNMNLQAALTLATQADMSIKNATSRVLLQPFGDKALSHIEEESNDLYNEQNNDPDTLYSTGNGSLEIKKVNPFLHFSPTKKRDFPKATTLTSYRRTTIPHGTFSRLLFESPSHGSGGESGSGEYYASAREHHQKEKPVHSKTNVSLPSKEKNHAGIIGAQDEATITKCKKMGKADYRKKCPPGWLPFDEFCYLFVSKSNGRWEEFPQRCNEENGVLAMPKTDKELEFLQDKILSSKQRTKRFYIGLKKKNGIWTWVDDVPYIRDVHVKDELGNKNCAALFKGDIRMVTCSKPKAGYICETRTGAQVLPILAFGDSLTTGYHCDDSSHTPYGNTLEYLLNKDIHRCYTVTTEGKEGTEAGQMFTRLQNHLKYAKSKYSWVIILAGTNDIAHNSHTRNRKSWDTAVEHIINLHITSHRYGAKTVAVTIPEMDCEESKRPPCLHTHLERKYINEKLRHYARSNEFTVLCDLAVKFPRYSLSSDERKLMWEVGLHMKPAGYERMAEIIYKDMLAHS